jgi:hypothetical protein
MFSIVVVAGISFHPGTIYFLPLKIEVNKTGGKE